MMAFAVRLDLPHGSGVGSVKGDIGRWLDSEGIKAVGLKSAEAPTGYTVEVSFSSDEDAERLRQQFGTPPLGTSGDIVSPPPLGALGQAPS
jgi:hypothetical protein